MVDLNRRAARVTGVPGTITRANNLAKRLEEVVREASTELEQIYRRARDQLVSGNDRILAANRDSRTVLRELMAIEPSAPPVRRHPSLGLPDDPRALRDAWGNLSRAEQDQLYRMDPFLGNRDGIPHVDRDRYNRQTLHRLRESVPEGTFAAAELRDLARLLSGRKPGEPEIFVSHVDRDGRVSFSLDNPDHADNTVVLLKPAGRQNIVAYAETATQQFRQAALTVDPTARTSVAFFGAYDQPRDMPQAIFPQFADDAGASVRGFHDGLRVTHEGDPAHTTTVGHSYGGVVAGRAAGQGETLDTDRMLFMGSWGTGVGHVDDLDFTGGAEGRAGENVFATMARRDVFQLMPDTHGPQPASTEFGATVFESNPKADSGQRWDTEDHRSTHYLDSSHPASQTIGRIITGRDVT
ncbi:alpha/beta hydrolase [Nocardia sp. NPDC001965]